MGSEGGWVVAARARQKKSPGTSRKIIQELTQTVLHDPKTQLNSSRHRTPGIAGVMGGMKTVPLRPEPRIMLLPRPCDERGVDDLRSTALLTQTQRAQMQPSLQACDDRAHFSYFFLIYHY